MDQISTFRKHQTMKRLTILRSSIILCIFFSLNVNAQLFTRTTFNAAYLPIATASGAIVSTATGNDVNQLAIPIGFNFNYAGVNYTSLGLNTNGLIWFDGVAPTSTEGKTNSNMVTTGAPNNGLSVWWNDLTDDASSDILYQTQGIAGSRTFTVQYTNYPSFTGTQGAAVRINCQVILYETTNSIEFRYGSLNITGNQTSIGGASIGLEYGTGGSGNFIDAITGSSFTSNRMLNPLSGWPSFHFRFEPGAPAPVPSGIYNVGAGQTYSNLTLATADINHRGISGPVTLNLTDAVYDTTVANGKNIFPVLLGPVAGNSAINTIKIVKTGAAATLSYRGSYTNGFIGCINSAVAISSSEEPILGLCVSYTTVSNIRLVSHGTAPHLVDRGLLVFQSSSLAGSKFNLLDKIAVDLDRANTNSIGIVQLRTINPGGYPATNSYNTYRDFSIRDCFSGMLLQSPGGVYEPDRGCKVITSSCNSFNTIGDAATANDIGAGAGTSYGLNMSSQYGFTVKNTLVRNVSVTNASRVDGILVVNIEGTCEISNCVVRTIRRNSTTSSANVSGIRISHVSSANVRLFNNSISEILSNYTGAATATRTAVGIFLEDASVAGTFKYEVWNNSVSIDGSSFPNASNACFEIANATANTYIVKNNVFANFTAAQAGIASHYCWVTPSATTIGVASLSDYNDLFIANGQGTSGHIGLGGTTKYSSIANWQSGMTGNPGIDANSISANPFFTNNNSNLHGSPSSLAIQGAGTTPPGYTTFDFDCELRNPPFDIGFDDFSIPDSITLLSSFNPSGATSLCGLGYDPDSSHLWIYGCNAATIQRYSTSGTLLGSVNAAGGSANDVDVEMAPVDLTLNTGSISKGQLLFVNGETGVADIYAYSKTTGLVTDTLITSFGNSHVVGGAYHELRNTFFLVQDNVPGAAFENLIAEVHPVTGATLNTFQTTGIFNISFGDIEVGENGNLFVVSSIESGIAEFTPAGTFLKIHALPAGVNDLSGIALDCNSNQAWVCSNAGVVYQLGQFPCGNIPSVQLNLGLFIEGYYTDVNEMRPVLANSSISSNLLECDSVEVELRGMNSPYAVFANYTTVLRTDGLASLSLPISFLGGTYYIVVKGRNLIETWSKIPVTLTALTNYNFRE